MSQKKIIHENIISQLAQIGLQYHFFVSYSSEDASYASGIVEKLQSLGLRVYFDRDKGENDPAPRFSGDLRGKLIPGDNSHIGGHLAKELSLSLFLLVIATDRSFRSPWVSQELAYFFNKARPIMVWHPEGDYRKTRSYNAQLYPFSKSQFLAISGEVEFPFVIQHIPESVNDLQAAVSRINLFLELTEITLWKGEQITCDNVEKYSNMHQNYKIRAQDLRHAITQKYGRMLIATRTITAELMPLSNKREKRYKPWIVREVEHWERILSDMSYRNRELEKAGHNRN